MKPLAVTIAEAVKISGLGRSSLYKLFNSGTLSPRKYGKRTLIIVDELEKVLGNLPTESSQSFHRQTE